MIEHLTNFQNFNNERIFKTISMCVSKTKEKIIEAFERLTLQLDKGYWREKHTSHHDSHQGKRKLRSFKYIWVRFNQNSFTLRK